MIGPMANLVKNDKSKKYKCRDFDALAELQVQT